MIIGRRLTEGPFTIADYGPCPRCQEWLRMTMLKRHQKNVREVKKSILPSVTLRFRVMSSVGEWKENPVARCWKKSTQQ